jgi:N-acetylglucosamine-6-phosphate deacetylase
VPPQEAGATFFIENALVPTRRGLERVTIVISGERVVGLLPLGDGRPDGAGHATPRREAPRLDAAGRFAVPGFVDLHVHGAAGVDFTAADGGRLEALRALSSYLAAHGVTAFCATTLSAGPDVLLEAVEAVAEAAEASAAASTADPTASAGGIQPKTSKTPWPGARVLGCHLEGPFLSPIRRGAQPLDALRPPDLAEMEALVRASRGTLRIVTLAPELPGAFEVVRWLAARGVVVAAGHTDATYEETATAVAAGLTHSAHTFNGMRPLAHRDPGVLGAVMNHDEILAEVIADGLHVSRHVVRLLCRAKGIRRVAVVSDLTHLAGLEPGEYDFAGQRVEVTAGRVTVKETGGLAGSVSPLNEAFRNLLEWGFSVREAALLTSGNARRQMGLLGADGVIEEGCPADIAVVGADGEVVLTLAGGRVIHAAPGTGLAVARETDPG